MAPPPPMGVTQGSIIPPQQRPVSETDSMPSLVTCSTGPVDSGNSSVNALSEISRSEVRNNSLDHKCVIGTKFIFETLRLKKSSRVEVLAATQSPTRARRMNLEEQSMKTYLFIHLILLPNLFELVLYHIPELPALTTSVSLDI